MLKYLSIIIVLLAIVFLSPAIGADRMIFGALDAAGSGDKITMIGRYDVSLSGIWSGTMVLNRRFVGRPGWLTVATFANDTENTETGGYQASPATYIFDTTSMTSGSAHWVLGWSGRAPR